MSFFITLASCVAFGLLVTYGIWGGKDALPFPEGGSGIPFAWKLNIAWHAVLMTMAFGVLMPMGRWSYHAFAGLKQSQRKVHRVVMILAVTSMLVGIWGAIWARWGKFFGYNWSKGEWHIDPETRNGQARIVHIYLGWTMILLSLAQAVMGIMKANKMANEGEDQKIFRLHGTQGKLIIVCGCFNVLVASYFWGAWNTLWKMLIAAVGTMVIGLGAYGTNSDLGSAPAQIRLTEMT